MSPQNIDFQKVRLAQEPYYYFCGLNVLVPTKKAPLDTLSLNMRVFGSGVFLEEPNSGALQNGTSALKKESREIPNPFCYVTLQQEGT